MGLYEEETLQQMSQSSLEVSLQLEYQPAKPSKLKPTNRSQILSSILLRAHLAKQNETLNPKPMALSDAKPCQHKA